MNLRKLIRYYIFADILVSIVTWLLFYAFRWVANDVFIFTKAPIITPSFNFFLAITFYPFCCVLFSYLSGFYDTKKNRSRIEEFILTFVSTLLSSLVTFFIILLDDLVVSYRFYYQSFLVLWGLQFLLMWIVRFSITQSYFRKIRKGKIKFNLVIIGTGSTAEKTAFNINNKIRFYGSNFVGFVQVNRERINVSGPVIGNMKNIDKILINNNVRHVIIAIDNEDDASIFSIINAIIKHKDIEIDILPRQLEILIGRTSLGDVDSMPLINLSALSMPAWQRSVKRFADIVISLIALVVLSPFLIYVSIRIKLTSKGPILFRQERIGRNGMPFTIYKFRSMYDHAEEGLPCLTQENDSRITPYGKHMRKYRIDEIPQLFNVLKGDMSIVGPRPERSYFIEQIMEEAPYYCLLYKIQPGLLSWGPIKIGYAHTIDEMKERLNYDIIYTDNMSLFNDLKIIAYSIEIILKGKGI